MNQLTRSVLTLPVCGMPRELPYPPLHKFRKQEACLEFDPALPPEEYRYFGHGIPDYTLPYSRLTGYTRERRVQSIPTLVLENRRLRATFVPSLGGRLWSLWDKQEQRELLYANSVLQFGKLAIRDAWFSGGIEWNVGFVGHSPFTATDVFAARLTGAAGQPVLRFYEWERVTGTPFQIDCFFPDADSDRLYTAVRIVNPDDRPTSTYWWSNVACPETAHTRVIVPTGQALTHEGAIRLIRQTEHNGCDASYPARVDHSLDYFYYMPEGTRPWEAAVEADGRGLLCTATAVMRGRKLFVWGHGVGGLHWTEFLSEPDRPYIEIQSGLAKTQMECLPLAPHDSYFWVETFGPVAVDPAQAHATDYQVARDAVAAIVEAGLNEAAIEKVAAAALVIARRPPEELLHTASGWAALELLRRAADGEAPFEFGAVAYPGHTLDVLQSPWLALLEGRLPDEAALDLPSWQVSDAWFARLRQAEQWPGGDVHLWLQFQLALNEFVRGRHGAALERLTAIPATRRTHGNLNRVLAFCHETLNQPEAALAAWRLVLGQCSGEPCLLAEALPTFLQTGHAAEFLKLLPGNDDHGRVRLLRAYCLLELGELDAVEELLATPFEVPDLLEGEAGLSDLWIELQCRRAALRENRPWSRAAYCALWPRFQTEVPRWADFRMMIRPPTE